MNRTSTNTLSRGEAITQALNNISDYLNRNTIVIPVSSLWLESLTGDMKDLIDGVMSKYPLGSTIYEVAKLALQADDVDAITTLTIVYDSYLPLRWDILSRYIRSTSMYLVLRDQIKDPDILDRLNQQYQEGGSCNPPVEKRDAINPKKIGCLTLEDIHEFLFTHMSNEPVPDLDAVALPDNVDRYQGKDMTLVIQVLDAAIRAGMVDVIDYIVGEYGFQHAPVLRIGVPPDPLKVLEEASHDALIWLIDREYYEADDLTNAVVYDEAEMIQDDVLNTDGIVATLRYDRVDIYNNYKDQIDKYVQDNPLMVEVATGTVQERLLSNINIVEAYIDDTDLTVEMADTMMKTVIGTDIEIQLWDIIFHTDMVEIADKYLNRENIMYILSTVDHVVMGSYIYTYLVQIGII